ncbi:MAG: hypothetical protein QOI42_1305, partial [Frankiaceae bacterium]|nr:hypothetical protein [Frankiaceae bacterium]
MPQYFSDSRPRWRAALATTTLAVTGALVGAPSAAHADVTTVSSANTRTAWDSTETRLTPTDVKATDFGQLFDRTLSGSIYAQPLVSGSSVLVTTEKANAYALDADTGAVKWTKNFGAPFQSASIWCGDLTPDVGSTSTGVVDPATNTFDFPTKIADGPDTSHPHWYLHALDVATGAERTGWPVTIAGTAQNDPAYTFNAFGEMQRPGLLLTGGVVYMGFGGHCDIPPYRGWVVGVSTATHAITSMWVSETGSTDGNGIWMSGSGLVSDGPGRILFATGNGADPAPSAGSSQPGNVGESVVRLSVNPDGSLTTADFFTPSNAQTLDVNDADFGSGGPIALPDSFGSPAHPHLLAQMGKDGRLFLLDRDHLGGMAQGPNGTDSVVSQSGPFNGLWGHAAAWSGGGGAGQLYLIDNSGYLRSFSGGVDGSGVPTLAYTGRS